MSSLRRTRQASHSLKRSIIRQRNRVSDVNRTAAENFRTQPAAMDQTTQRAAFRQSLQVCARLAKPCAAETHSTDEKLPFDQVIERHAASTILRRDLPGATSIS